MLTLIGLLTICSLVVLLLIGRMSPVLPLIVVPLLGALAAGFGPEAISGFFTDGIGRVTAIATMFVFAITFFGVLSACWRISTVPAPPPSCSPFPPCCRCTSSCA